MKNLRHVGRKHCFHKCNEGQKMFYFEDLNPQKTFFLRSEIPPSCLTMAICSQAIRLFNRKTILELSGAVFLKFIAVIPCKSIPTQLQNILTKCVKVKSLLYVTGR